MVEHLRVTTSDLRFLTECAIIATAALTSFIDMTRERERERESKIWWNIKNNALSCNSTRYDKSYIIYNMTVSKRQGTKS